MNPCHAKDEALPARLPVETGGNEHDCGPCGQARALINTHTSSAPSEHSFVARHWTIYIARLGLLWLPRLAS